MANAWQESIRNRFYNGSPDGNPDLQRMQLELLARAMDKGVSFKEAASGKSMPNFFDQIQDPDSEMSGNRQMILSRIMRELDNPSDPRTVFPQMYTPEQIRETHGRLQRGQSMGALLSGSGDPALTNVAKILSSQDPTDYLRNVAKDEQVRRYQQWQADYGSRPDRLTALTRTLSALDGGRGKNIPLGAQRDMITGATALQELGQVKRNFQPRFQQVLGKYTSVFKGIPPWAVQNGLEEVLANVVDAGAKPQEIQDIRDSANWWAEFYRTWVAPGRHELFGATLTPSEEQAWQDLVGITAATAPEEVERRLNQLYSAKLKSERRRAKTHATEYGRDTVEASYGDLLDFNEEPSSDESGPLILEIDTSGRTPAAGSGGPRKVVVDGIEVEVLE